MKFDMHCHTKEGSMDGKVMIEEYIRTLKRKGFGGMLVSCLLYTSRITRMKKDLLPTPGDLFSYPNLINTKNRSFQLPSYMLK